MLSGQCSISLSRCGPDFRASVALQRRARSSSVSRVVMLDGGGSLPSSACIMRGLRRSSCSIALSRSNNSRTVRPALLLRARLAERSRRSTMPATVLAASRASEKKLPGPASMSQHTERRPITADQAHITACVPLFIGLSTMVCDCMPFPGMPACVKTGNSCGPESS